MLGVEMALREEGGEEGQKAEAKEWQRGMLEVYVPPPAKERGEEEGA